MYSVVATVLIDCHEEGITPYIAGDFNARPGNFTLLFNNGIWSYEDNKDNSYFRDLFMACNVRPINGLKYGNREIHNDFTYFGGNGKSRIDFCLTDNVGKKYIKSFKIIRIGIFQTTD